MKLGEIKLADMYKIFAFTYISILLISCRSASLVENKIPAISWQYSDLRLFDPVDTSEPGLDMIALYTRVYDKYFRVRVDFLDLISESRQDLYFLFDTIPGGTNYLHIGPSEIYVSLEWDYMINIPASGNVVIMNDHNLPINNKQLLITRDNDQDHLDLSFYKDPFQLNNINSKITILSTFPAKSIIVDQLSDVSIDALPPRE